MRLLRRLQVAVTWAGFYTLRFCERALPTSVLSLLLLPFSASWDLLHLPKQKLLASWHRFPDSWHPRPMRYFFRQGLGLSHSRLIYTWPDRLCSPSWLRRCYLEGAGSLEEAQKSGRPIVLASLHFGPFETLPYWLRAHGIVITMIRGLAPPETLRGLANYQHSLSPPPGVPLFIPAQDFTPLPRFARVSQFLGPGRCLLIAVDANRGIQCEVPFENRSFRMATGAIRLAGMSGAELIPCLITQAGAWKFRIHLGTAVPQEHLGSSPDLVQSGSHLLKEFSKVIARYPDQCRFRFLSALSLAKTQTRAVSENLSPAQCG